MWTTPHVLTEVSNFVGHDAEDDRVLLRLVLRALAPLLNETFRPFSDLLAGDSFLRFGITDCALHEAVRDGYLLLTADDSLADFLGRQGSAVLPLSLVLRGL